MMSRIDRIRRALISRRASRLDGESADSAEETARVQLPVVVEAVATTARPLRTERRSGGAAFFAQMIGQEGQRRGLRAGAPLLNQARVTYNHIEWSGARDRRARKGRQAREDV